MEATILDYRLLKKEYKRRREADQVKAKKFNTKVKCNESKDDRDDILTDYILKDYLDKVGG